jgi:hypothetical protein
MNYKKILVSFSFTNNKGETEQYENEINGTHKLELAMAKTLREARKTVLKGRRLKFLSVSAERMSE